MSPTRTRIKTAAAAALTLLALGTAGCGADAAPDPAPHADMRRSFTDRGNEVLCDARHDIARETLGAVFAGDDPTPDETRRRFLPPYLEIRDGLRELTPPASVSKEFATVLAGLDDAITVASADPSQLLGDHDPFARTEARLATLGLDGCA